MPLRAIREFLDRHGVAYEAVVHERSMTALETATAAHVPLREMAKVVIVRVDGALCMVVLPALYRVDLTSIREVLGARQVELASEAEFGARFQECEVGAMPPLGGLYGMGVFVHDKLAEDEYIAFNAGTHTEVVRMKYQDFADLVKPTAGDFSMHRRGSIAEHAL